MKHVFILLFFLSFTSQAADVGDVCERIRNPDLQKECYDEIPGSFFQEKAVGACLRYFVADAKKLACVRAVKDKEYLKAELRVVKSEDSTARKILWLQRLGKKIQ